MHYSKLTDLQLLYIHNKVLIPELEYRSQVTVLSKADCDTISSPILSLIKTKLQLARSTPNAMFYNRWIYNYRDFYGVQLQAKLELRIFYPRFGYPTRPDPKIRVGSDS